jgi:general secretion pathway protein D
VQSTRRLPSGVTTNIRVIENNVVADDGQIIVLGGLIKDDTGDNRRKSARPGRHPDHRQPVQVPHAQPQQDQPDGVPAPGDRAQQGRQQRDSATDRYDYMRSAGDQGGQPPKDSVLLPDYGTPVLPPLTNGQPPAGGAMAPMPAAAPLRRPRPAAAAQRRHEPAKFRPVTPAEPEIRRS